MDDLTPESTGQIRADYLTRFKPGNPGRPKGSRSRLSEAFLKALADDFEQHGILAIQEARQKSPDAYMRVVASLEPKESKVDMTSRKEESLSEEQARIHAEEYLAGLGRKQPSAEPPHKLHAVDAPGLPDGGATPEDSGGA